MRTGLVDRCCDDESCFGENDCDGRMLRSGDMTPGTGYPELS